MAIKNIIARGIGFAAGAIKWIVTHGFGSGTATVADPDRTYTVPAQDRFYDVPEQDRFFNVAAQDRFYEVPA